MASNTNNSGGVLGFNKLFIMIPVMLAARKINAEDPTTVQWLRIAYGTVQLLCVLVVLYTYVQASAFASANKKKKVVVYIPSAPTVRLFWGDMKDVGLVLQILFCTLLICFLLRSLFIFASLLYSRQPFAGPDAKKKYTEAKYGDHIASTAQSLVGSTLFGIALTVGLHIYKGMAMGLAIQTIMGPINLMENPVVKALLMGSGFRPQDKIFDEKTSNELTPQDEIVDESGNTVTRQVVGPGASTGGGSGNTFEDIMLDTWDAGNKADISNFMEAVTKKNSNYRTKENGWTPLMVLAGLNAKGTAMKELGGNPAIVDVEGWNALHWAAFHGSVDAAKELVKDTSLLNVKDKEGKLPLEMAKSEGNNDVAKYLETVIASEKSNPNDGAESEGLRKRK
ncbi:MAG: hypothetical protein SGARI_002775 [Bacillariaceae sp.]